MVRIRYEPPWCFSSWPFKQSALAAATPSGDELRWFVIDAIPISNIDINGLLVLMDLQQTLARRNVRLI